MGNKKYNEVDFDRCPAVESVKEIIAENCCLNRTAYLIYIDSTGRQLTRPNVIGNKTEGALIIMAKQWVSLYMSSVVEYDKVIILTERIVSIGV